MLRGDPRAPCDDEPGGDLGGLNYLSRADRARSTHLHILYNAVFIHMQVKSLPILAAATKNTKF